MHSFDFSRATDIDGASAAGRRGERIIAGGTTLVDLMRETVERPNAIVDINALPLRDVSLTGDGRLKIGALVTMSDAAAHPMVRERFAVLAQALELSASPQLRNMATIGGNVMQRTRCSYFRDVSAACNKRVPGSGCSAISGHNRSHAILGGSGECVATHPSDAAVAFAALDATVRVHGTDGERRIVFADFLLQPGDTPDREQALRAGDVILGIEIPAHPRMLRSGYLKVRDRQSYEFALTSAAVAMHVDAGVIRLARVAAGGVGTVPWRLPAVEQRLVGARPSAETFAAAAAVSTDGARPLTHNGFKVDLLRRTVERALLTVAATR